MIGSVEMFSMVFVALPFLFFLFCPLFPLLAVWEKARATFDEGVISGVFFFLIFVV